MADNGTTLTTGEFSELTGIAVSTITKLLRQKKIHGEKRGGKWAIFQSALQDKVLAQNQNHGSSSTDLGPIFDPPRISNQTHTLEAFVQMTYLTESGVLQWLKDGRLSGGSDADGNPYVDVSNLDRPEIQHLIRK